MRLFQRRAGLILTPPLGDYFRRHHETGADISVWAWEARFGHPRTPHKHNGLGMLLALTLSSLMTQPYSHSGYDHKEG